MTREASGFAAVKYLLPASNISVRQTLQQFPQAFCLIPLAGQAVEQLRVTRRCAVELGSGQLSTVSIHSQPGPQRFRRRHAATGRRQRSDDRQHVHVVSGQRFGTTGIGDSRTKRCGLAGMPGPGTRLATKTLAKIDCSRVASGILTGRSGPDATSLP